MVSRRRAHRHGHTGSHSHRDVRLDVAVLYRVNMNRLCGVARPPLCRDNKGVEAASKFRNGVPLDACKKLRAKSGCAPAYAEPCSLKWRARLCEAFDSVKAVWGISRVSA